MSEPAAVSTAYIKMVNEDGSFFNEDNAKSKGGPYIIFKKKSSELTKTITRPLEKIVKFFILQLVVG